MKAKRISNPFRKGNQAARKMQVRFFLSLMVLLALVFILDMVMSPGSVLGIYGFSGTTLAAMMVIGDVDDVSDRKTHGSNIAYKIYLVDVDQINSDVPFPLPNQQREISTIPMKAGQYMKYFAAHDIPTYTSTGEKGDITTSGTNTFVAVMGGMRVTSCSISLNSMPEASSSSFSRKWAMRSGTSSATMTVRWYSPPSSPKMTRTGVM